MFLNIICFINVAASCSIFVLFALAGSAGILGRRGQGAPRDASRRARSIDAWAASPAFALFELFIAGIFLPPAPTALKAVASVAVAAIAAASFFGGKQCQCLGSFTPRSKPLLLSLRIGLLAAAALQLGSYCLLAPHASAAWDDLAPLSCFSWLLAAVLILKEATAGGAAPVVVAAATPAALAADSYVGQRRGLAVTLQALVLPNRPTLLLFLARDCHYCRQLLPFIDAFKTGFGAAFPVVIVYDGAVEQPQLQALDYFLSDERRTLYRSLAVAGAPAALLIDGNHYRPMAPITYGVEKIRLLFALAYNLAYPESASAS